MPARPMPPARARAANVASSKGASAVWSATRRNNAVFFNIALACFQGGAAGRPRRARRRFALAALLACLLASLPALARPAAAGALVEASCPCGYHAPRLPLFSGFANFRTVCLFPALCPDKGELVLVNLLAPGTRPAACPTGPLLSLADPAVAPADGEPAAQWRLPDNRVVRLLGGGYPCPRCGQKTLGFRQTGFWD